MGYGYVPHAGKQLNETAITESKSDHDVRSRDVPGTDVDSTQHESGEGESAQAERCRIGEFATFNGLVQTGLELSTEGGQRSVHGVDMGEGSVAEACGSAGHLVLFGGQLGLHGGTGAVLRSGTNVLLQPAVVNCFCRRHDAVLYELILSLKKGWNNKQKRKPASWI
jgi:hypothetical protein